MEARSSKPHREAERRTEQILEFDIKKYSEHTICNPYT